MDNRNGGSQNGPVRIAHWGLLAGRGGVEVLVMGLYSHMDRNKVQFDFLAEHDAPRMAFEDDIERMGGRVFRIMYSRHDSPTKAGTCVRDFLREHPEIRGIHVHTNFPYVEPLKQAAQVGLPLRILHSHNAGVQNDDHGNMLHQLIRKMRDTQIRHDIGRYPTHYFACSSLAAQYMFPGRPYTWIRNGIETDRFAYAEQTRERVRRELGLDDDTTAIGFCGRLRPQKNPVFLIDVFQRYLSLNPKSVLLIVGDGELRDDVAARVAKYGIADRVRFLGGERNDVNELYQAMDAFVLPSIFEGFGIVYLEAQCAGLPCLASADVVPKDVKVTDLLEFVSLQQDPDRWAHALDDRIRAVGPRRDHSEELRDAGFELADVAHRLQDFYLSHTGEETSEISKERNAR
ncbi:glycosyltransferase family 1 [Bifidobacterium tissieri]|uniref:Glycosyltransferase family 1 n=1 Tax=Bifidobacterium tissieri TaxID=1630162 RepID=A0A261FE17_9BIFI|nr:glycosyltransferase [Bifidobacterium tissieri]OZG57213.1 glycosyltransferase family 1 [Bifidobacterium tissieri]